MDSPPTYANIEAPPPAYQLSCGRPPCYYIATRTFNLPTDADQAESSRRTQPSADILSTLHRPRPHLDSSSSTSVNIFNRENGSSDFPHTTVNAIELPALTRTPTPYPRASSPATAGDLESVGRTRRTSHSRRYECCCCCWAMLFTFMIVAAIVTVAIVSGRLGDAHKPQALTWCEDPDGVAVRCATIETTSHRMKDKYVRM